MPKDIDSHIIDFFLDNSDTIEDPYLVEWLSEEKTNEVNFEKYQKIWRHTKTYTEVDAFDMNRAWSSIDDKLNKKRKLNRYITNPIYFLSASVATLLILLSLTVFQTSRQNTDVYFTVKADRGSRSEICLPDGSTVLLNADSEITYSFEPREKVRRISFKGEGFFDITKRKEPLIIRLENDLEVRVLGTSFNLRSYDDDQFIQTSLVKGSIELLHHNNTLLMNSGDVVHLDKKTNQLMCSENVLSHTIGWLENKIYMDNMSLNDLCNYLERLYGVEIFVLEDLADSIHYNGVLKEESIIDIMESLHRLSDINYQVKGREIFITSN